MITEANRKRILGTLKEIQKAVDVGTTGELQAAEKMTEVLSTRLHAAINESLDWDAETEKAGQDEGDTGGGGQPASA